MPPLTDQQIRAILSDLDRRLVEIEAWQDGATAVGKSASNNENSKLISDYIDRDQKSNESYTSIIMVIGYGALFTLWTQLKGAMPPWYFFLTGLLALVSAVLFVLFEVIKVGVASHVNTKWEEEDQIEDWFQARMKGQLRVNRCWPYFFYPTLVAGLGAGFLLSAWLLWSCLKAALSWL